MTALIDLYRKACFDWPNRREVVPKNLRQFTIYIYCYENRTINVTGQPGSNALSSLKQYASLPEINQRQIDQNKILLGLPLSSPGFSNPIPSIEEIKAGVQGIVGIGDKQTADDGFDNDKQFANNINDNTLFTLLKNYSFELKRNMPNPDIHSTFITNKASISLIHNVPQVFSKYFADNLLISPAFSPLFTIAKNIYPTPDPIKPSFIVLSIDNHNTSSLIMAMSTIDEEREVESSSGDLIKVRGYPALFESRNSTEIFIYQYENKIHSAIQNKTQLSISLIENQHYGIYKEEEQIGEADLNTGESVLFHFMNSNWNYNDLVSACLIFYNLLTIIASS
jgi:hypothetical protein